MKMASAVYSPQSSLARWFEEATPQEGAPSEIVRPHDVAEESNASPAGESIPRAFEGMIGASQALKRVIAHVKTVAPTDSTVLLEGETGTGKELISRAIHTLSQRKGRNFVKFNCGAVPSGLLESW